MPAFGGPLIIDLLSVLLPSLTGILTIAVLTVDGIKNRESPHLAVIALLLSLNISNVLIIFNQSLFHRTFYFGKPVSPLDFMTLIALGSTIFTAPFFVHTLFPARKIGRINLFFLAYSASFILFNLMGFFPSGTLFIIGGFSFLIGHGIYAIIYGIVALIKAGRINLWRYREGHYGLCVLMIFLVSLPFLMVGDFILIPLGICPPASRFLSWHTWMLNGAFLFVALRRKPWLGREQFFLTTEAGDEPGPVVSLDELAERFGLSPRESDVLRALLANRHYKDIAEELCISLATVKTHALRIYQKTGAANRRELGKLFREKSAVSASDQEKGA